MCFKIHSIMYFKNLAMKLGCRYCIGIMVQIVMPERIKKTQIP